MTEKTTENSPLAWIFLDFASLQRARTTGNPGFKTLRLIARTDCMFVMFVWNFSASTFNAAMYTDLSKIHIHLCICVLYNSNNKPTMMMDIKPTLSDRVKSIA